METRFENEYIRDKQTAKDIYGYWYFKRPIMIACYIVLGIWAVIYSMGAMLIPGFASDNFVVAFVVTASMSIILFAYYNQVNGMVKRDMELARGREILCKSTVTDREINFSNFGNEVSISIDSIKYAFITNQYIALVTKAKLMCMFKKDGFTVGDTDSFIAFLREKGIRIKGKKK